MVWYRKIKHGMVLLIIPFELMWMPFSVNKFFSYYPPQIVLPSKAIKNERILETLMFQANSGMYRIQDSYIEACQQRIQKQDSRFSESFDYGL